VEKHHSQQEIKGTGLGLSIVKRAIEAHGGAIGVTSVPGRETKFLITVPKARG
jgi:two-component system phosphate regulon sensor histidine kinase PhoR